MASNTPWNKGKIIGQKAPLRQQEIWSIRARLEIANNLKELALFNLAIDSKLRGCDLVALKVSDVMRSGDILTRTSVVQQKTGTPVMFEIIAHTRQSLRKWIAHAKLSHDNYLLPSRKHTVPMTGWYINGSTRLVWIAASMALTLCAEPKCLFCTSGIKTCALFSCC